MRRVGASADRALRYPFSFMQTRILERLDEIPAFEWNRLVGDQNPFLRHEFLNGLERHGCVGESSGWIPQHVVVRDEGRLVGAAPMYLKYNSYGEFVFDWSWADAYRRLRLAYYPKLVVAVPYTPVTGQRLLIANEASPQRVTAAIVEATRRHARRVKASSLHWLFTTEAQTADLEQAGFMPRTGYQFHWTNRGYRDFDDLLSEFNASRRKKIKRERRYVDEAGIDIEVLGGHQVTESQWAVMHSFYRNTFDRRGGWPTLTQGFFQSLGETMPSNVVLVLARHRTRYVAGAFNLRGSEVLYGRHWGCSEEFHSLHFELCYYRTLDYCIGHRLKRFEAGAQGEHKLARGFLPVRTYSAHELQHEGMQQVVGDFLMRERHAVDQYIAELEGHSPFKANP